MPIRAYGWHYQTLLFCSFTIALVRGAWTVFKRPRRCRSRQTVVSGTVALCLVASRGVKLLGVGQTFGTLVTRSPMLIAIYWERLTEGCCLGYICAMRFTMLGAALACAGSLAGAARLRMLRWSSELWRRGPTVGACGGLQEGISTDALTTFGGAYADGRFGSVLGNGGDVVDLA